MFAIVMFSVVDVYLDHLKRCVVCINSRRYVCCSECNVVSNECNEPTSFYSPSSTTIQINLFSDNCIRDIFM